MDNSNYEIVYIAAPIIGWAASATYYRIKEKVKQRQLEKIVLEESIQRLYHGTIFRDRNVHTKHLKN